MMMRLSRSLGGPVTWIGWTFGSGSGSGGLTGSAWQTSGAALADGALLAAAVACGTALRKPTGRATTARIEARRLIDLHLTPDRRHVRLSAPRRPRRGDAIHAPDLRAPNR